MAEAEEFRRWVRRRAITATLVGLATTIFLGGAIGFAAAGEPEGPIPDRFSVPKPHVGDRAEYDASIVSRTAEGVLEEQAGVPTALLEWLPPRDLLGHDGTPHRVNILRSAHVAVNSSTEAGITGIRNRTIDGPWPGSFDAFDAATGRLVAMGSAPAGAVHAEGGHAYFLILSPENTTAGNLPLCGTMNPLQGRDHATDAPVALFQDCDISHGGAVNARFRAVAADNIAGDDCVVYARSKLLAWVGSDDREMFVWMCTDVPYPVRMAIEDRVHDDRFIVYRLTNWTRGTEPLAGPGDAPTIEPPPPMQWDPWTPSGPSERGLDHPFPLSEAVAYAENDPDGHRLRQFRATHADAHIPMADYAENEYDGRIDRYWWFAYAVQGATLPVGVVETETTDGALTYRYANWTEPVEGRLSGAVDELAPRPLLPDELPTIASALGWLHAYSISEREPESYGWGYRITPSFHWCQADPTGHECAPDVQVWVGHVRHHEAEFPTDPPFAIGAPDRNVLTFNVDSEAKTVRVGFATEAWRAPDGASPPEEDVRALSDDVVTMDLGTWKFPAGRYGVSAALLGIATALLYYLWPAAKSAIAAALFSRIERPRALDHPVRAEIAQYLTEHPGAHFSRIARDLGIRPSTLKHHLAKLVHVGLVTKITAIGYSCYAPAGSLDRRLLAALPSLQTPGPRNILRHLVEAPGASLTETARRVDLDTTTVSYHIGRLTEAGLVTTQRDGGRLRIEPTETATAALAVVGFP